MIRAVGRDVETRVELAQTWTIPGSGCVRDDYRMAWHVILSPRVTDSVTLLFNDPAGLDCDATMVYIASWQEYQEAAENLYVKSQNKVGCIINGTLLNYTTSRRHDIV